MMNILKRYPMLDPMHVVLFVLLIIPGCQTPQTSPEALKRPTTPARYQELRQHTASPAGEDLDPEVSPDGTKLYFATSAYSPGLDIYEKNLDGMVLRQVTRSESDERFPKINPVHPDMLAFCSNLNGDWDIFIIDDTNKNNPWKRVTESDTDDIHPSWSPDGRYLVYCSSALEHDDWDLKVFDTRTAKILTLPVDGLLPQWNPAAGDNRIVFQRMRHRDNWYGAIWTLTFDQGEVKDLTEIIGSADWAAINPAWSRDGKRIAFATVAKSRDKKESLNRGDDVWVMTPQGHALTQITVDDSSDWMPTWGPDDRIFFISNRAERNHIWSLKPVLPIPSGQ